MNAASNSPHPPFESKLLYGFAVLLTQSTISPGMSSVTCISRTCHELFVYACSGSAVAV